MKFAILLLITPAILAKHHVHMETRMEHEIFEAEEKMGEGVENEIDIMEEL